MKRFAEKVEKAHQILTYNTPFHSSSDRALERKLLAFRMRDSAVIQQQVRRTSELVFVVLFRSSLWPGCAVRNS